ncbi:NUDIX hydrolase domain containing protein [Aphelenchoides besseyi]|nr:NUDIX hydrolase domain containing protein [Aphelenchoides besseyi]KAI6195447.1 NUDIX hydrolase domain containing protein [Aphelenchoides besseyi]
MNVEELRSRFATILLEDSATYKSDRPLSSHVKSEASVLILLDQREDNWYVFLTLRSQNLRKHGGEVSFPGGKREVGDRDAVETALRETEEETGLQIDATELVGVLRPILSKFMILIHPVVCVLRRRFVPKPNVEEVDRCFWVPLRGFLEDEGHYVVKAGIYRMHRFDFGEETIFGLTAYLCILTAMIVFDVYPKFRLFREDDRKYRENDVAVGDAVRFEFDANAVVDKKVAVHMDDYVAAGRVGKI